MILSVLSYGVEKIMTVVYSWLLEKRIIYIYNCGEITRDELMAVNEIVQPMVREGTKFVHTITDGTDIEKVAVGLGDIRQAFFGRIQDIEKRGWTITVTPSAMQRFFSSVMYQWADIRNRHYATMEEALRFLVESDDTLPPYETLLERHHENRARIIAELDQSTDTAAE